MGQNYSISLDLSSYGKVTAEVEYYIGHHGSYWEPPESDEVCVKSIQNQNGEEVFLTDEEHEEYYNLFVNAASDLHYDSANRHYKEYAESLNEDSFDPLF